MLASTREREVGMLNVGLHCLLALTKASSVIGFSPTEISKTLISSHQIKSAILSRTMRGPCQSPLEAIASHPATLVVVRSGYQ